jgi:hypothetical protein
MGPGDGLVDGFVAGYASFIFRTIKTKITGCWETTTYRSDEGVVERL